MSKLSAEMRDALAQVQGAFDDAEIYERWTPDDGTYDCLLKDVKVKVGEDKKTKDKNVKVGLVFQILDGEDSGRTFTMSFQSIFPSFTGNLFALVTLATGDRTARDTKNYGLATATLADLTGSLVAKIQKSSTEKDGKTFPNYDVLEVSTN